MARGTRIGPVRGNRDALDRTAYLHFGWKIVGPRVHEARIAALCRQHGVRELWSADRDFKRFAGLRTVNPLNL